MRRAPVMPHVDHVQVKKLPIGWWVSDPRGGWCPTSSVLRHTLGRLESRRQIVAEIVSAVREGSAGSWHGDYWADYIEEHFGRWS